MRDRPLSASGIQIAFLVFTVVFLGAPAEKYLGPWLAPELNLPQSLGRLFFFIPGILILVLVPQLRAFCRDEIRVPIPREKRLEVAFALGAQALLPFAIFGGVVLWHWMAGGEMALARRLGMEDSPHTALANSVSLDGLLRLALAVLIAPFVEELVFRGMLLRAWEAEWGWFVSIIATSVVFAAYHPVPAAAFASSVLLCTLYRRSRSLRACILAHAVYNALLWYPLMGQFVFRTRGKETGEIELWPFHLSMLALLAISLPIYVWMARDRETQEPSDTGDAVAANS